MKPQHKRLLWVYCSQNQVFCWAEPHKNLTELSKIYITANCNSMLALKHPLKHAKLC